MIASLLSSGNVHMTGLITAESSAGGSNFHVSRSRNDLKKKSLLGINGRALVSYDCVSDPVKGSAAHCKRLGFGLSLQLNHF